MINIIKDNSIVSCSCGCKFIYDKEDLKPLWPHPGYFYIICPKCSERTIFITEEKPLKQNITINNEEK
jgi:hypothetical protein